MFFKIKKWFVSLINSESFSTPLYAFITSRIFLLFISWWAQYFPVSDSYPIKEAISRGWIITPIRWLDIWARWDSGWYLAIAEHGYFPIGSDYISGIQSSWPFFPLYPLLIKIIHSILFLPSKPIFYLIIAVVISQIILFTLLLILYRWVKKTWSAEIAENTTWILVTFPTSFFLSTAYTESMFIFLSLLTIILGWKKQWSLAVLAGALAVLTRSAGIFLLIPLLSFWYKDCFKKQNSITNLLKIGLLPLSLIVFFYYAWTMTGDILAPISSQSAWSHEFLYPWQTWFSSKGWFGFITPLDKLIGIFSFLILTWQLITEKHWKKRVLWLYGILLMIYPLFTGLLASLSRYYLAAAPIIAISFALFLQKFTRLKQPLIIMFVVAQVFYFLSWTQLYWAG